ncbi:hypothetical protein HPB52_018678 [Rhipicephalus sanguineus]|uniref:Potassium channel tetramerisation-type BTB domain-containing protein n=1 Tax=Rhipicephalus sanguineus TaxID=34632 RepID=A0A9D4ST74_RHISA|nr:hypothetical protein HPB52_018678 [Rhipicephalus sanguineus]
MCAKARTIVGYYKRSSTARARLQEIQKQLSVDPPLELVQDVPTRWNSEFAMLARLLKLKTAVTIDLSENDSVENLTNGEWRQVSAFVTVLQPVEEATTAACAESYPTLSLVVPLVHCMKLLLCDKTSDCDEYDFAQNLLKSINARNALFRGEPREMFGCLFGLDTDGGLCLKEKDVHGAYLLDRCPTYVEPILEYLQNGRLLLNDKVSYPGVIEEAKFFGVDEIIPDIERRMTGYDLSGVDLSRLDLHLLDFRGANLTMCNLERADLSHSDFEASSPGAQLYGAKMMYADLKGADLRSCKMGDPDGPLAWNADLSWANLTDAIMDESVLYGVNFRYATLTNASLQNCDLRHAVLGNADVLDKCSRPARLHQETHPDWAPTLLLGYTRKSEGIARYERAARRRTKRPTPEVDAGTTAPSRNSGFAATSPENCCDDGDNGTHSEDSPPLLQAECEIQAAENESGVAVQAEMSMADVAALELQCTMLNDNLYALREYIDKLEWTEAAFRETNGYETLSCESRYTQVDRGATPCKRVTLSGDEEVIREVTSSRPSASSVQCRARSSASRKAWSAPTGKLAVRSALRRLGSGVATKLLAFAERMRSFWIFWRRKHKVGQPRCEEDAHELCENGMALFYVRRSFSSLGAEKKCRTDELVSFGTRSYSRAQNTPR